MREQLLPTPIPYQQQNHSLYIMSFDLVIYYSVVPIAPVAGIWLPGVIEFIDRMGTYLLTSDSSERLMCIVKRSLLSLVCTTNSFVLDPYIGLHVALDICSIV